ncbi:proline-rich receptor-like protein kinase PERK8 [Panicum virgatum]|uniref:proline-rich receptor-like protein kinase PERK8 n=1 Tax=Panicum virgatum TaxID=38727 RepID=UPI0019D50556|nr:proline-rich receptor-like protein kinase PERK8 [Panicum virgatum]
MTGGPLAVAHLRAPTLRRRQQARACPTLAAAPGACWLPHFPVKNVPLLLPPPVPPLTPHSTRARRAPTPTTRCTLAPNPAACVPPAAPASCPPYTASLTPPPSQGSPTFLLAPAHLRRLPLTPASSPYTSRPLLQPPSTLADHRNRLPTFHSTFPKPYPHYSGDSPRWNALAAAAPECCSVELPSSAIPDPKPTHQEVACNPLVLLHPSPTVGEPRCRRNPAV